MNFEQEYEGIPENILPLLNIIGANGNCCKPENKHINMTPEKYGHPDAYPSRDDYIQAKNKFYEDIERAKSLCVSCPVIDPCFQFNTAIRMTGVYAGSDKVHERREYGPQLFGVALEQFVLDSIAKFGNQKLGA